MSHLVGVDLDVVDLDALVEAVEGSCNLVKVDTQFYDWYGTFMADYHGDDAAYKLGIKPEDYGKCLFALVQADSPVGKAELAARAQGRHLTHEEAMAIRALSPCRTAPYAVGVVAHPQKPGMYALLYDFWSGGHGLKAKVGESCNNIRQAYGLAVSRRVALSTPGAKIVGERRLEDGRIHMKVRTPVS